MKNEHRVVNVNLFHIDYPAFNFHVCDPALSSTVATLRSFFTVLTLHSISPTLPCDHFHTCHPLFTFTYTTRLSISLLISGAQNLTRATLRSLPRSFHFAYPAVALHYSYPEFKFIRASGYFSPSLPGFRANHIEVFLSRDFKIRLYYFASKSGLRGNSRFSPRLPGYRSSPKLPGTQLCAREIGEFHSRYPVFTLFKPQDKSFLRGGVVLFIFKIININLVLII